MLPCVIVGESAGMRRMTWEGSVARPLEQEVAEVEKRTREEVTGRRRGASGSRARRRSMGEEEGVGCCCWVFRLPRLLLSSSLLPDLSVLGVVVGVGCCCRCWGYCST